MICTSSRPEDDKATKRISCQASCFANVDGVLYFVDNTLFGDNTLLQRIAGHHEHPSSGRLLYSLSCY